MRILIAGSSGLIGTALSKSLSEQGHEVFKLVRRQDKVVKNSVFWRPEASFVNQKQLEDFDAFVNLAGDNIGERWDAEKKREIKSSRVDSTRTLADAILKLQSPPRVWINASATGFYGRFRDEEVNEDSASGEGFLAEVCRDWEAATTKASAAGVRVVLARNGVVLSTKGGALRKMLLPFKLGLGGRLGSGRQYLSWISIDDLVRGLEFALVNEQISGPVNLVSPHPVSNLEFTKVLGWALRRPTFLTVPAFALRAALGEMADETLLSSVRAYPKRLLDNGYKFSNAQLESALQFLLKNSA